MSNRNAYTVLHRRLRELRARDLDQLLAAAVSTAQQVNALDHLVARAAQAGAIDAAKRMRREAMAARAELERTVDVLVEAISDLDGDLVDDLLGDGGQTLAEILLAG